MEELEMKLKIQSSSRKLSGQNNIKDEMTKIEKRNNQYFVLELHWKLSVSFVDGFEI